MPSRDYIASPSLSSGRPLRAGPVGSSGLRLLIGFGRASGHTGIMAPKRPKRPRDPNQLGKLIVELSVGDARDTPAVVDSPAVEFARQGGLIGEWKAC